MNMFRVEAAGAQSLAGALPLHRLSCKAEDDVKSERDAHDLKDPISCEGKKKDVSCFTLHNPVYARRVNSLLLVCSLSSHRHSYIPLIFGSRFIDS
jgi:hypothetical protein